MYTHIIFSPVMVDLKGGNAMPKWAVKQTSFSCQDS